MAHAIRKFRAWLGGYFWLPCPRCSRMFGGFECGNDTVPTPPAGVYMICCRECE